MVNGRAPAWACISGGEMAEMNLSAIAAWYCRIRPKAGNSKLASAASAAMGKVGNASVGLK